MAKRKQSSALKWITTEAKRLKREYPRRYTKWTDYVKQASAIYASKHGGKSPVGKKRKKVSAVKILERGEKRNVHPHIVRVNRTKGGRFKKFTAVNSIHTDSATHIDRNRIHANIQLGRVGASSLKNELKKRIKEKIDRAVVRKYHATKKRVKTKIQRTITAAKAELRRLD